MTQADHFEPIEKATQGVIKACEEATGMACQHMDAAMKSASAMHKGFEEGMRNVNDVMQESVSRSVNAGKTIMGAKNAREMMDLQTEFVKELFDCWVSCTGRLSEISARMTQDMMAPIAEHANQAMQKITHKTSAAA